MGPGIKPSRGREAEEADFQSNNLWVGSLGTGTTESDLADLFGKFGEIDRITAYTSRSFAFVYFRRVEDAVAAKEALQGHSLNGSRIKIEYSRPAKPCKSLWVGGISPSVTKEHLQAEFSKFGKIEDFRFLRERNTAFVDFADLDDAIKALKSANGRRMGGGQLRVDYLRSQATKKDSLPNTYDGRGMGQTDGSLNAKRSLGPFGGKGDGQPSNILWIGYPPSVQIDEQMLHNAMILFGEIEKIKSYPAKHYSFVEFRSVEEARCAKEGLQGRLFNDPRITIMYSNSELAPGKDDPGYHAGGKRSRADTYLNDPQFRSSPMDSYGRNNQVASSNGILGSMRPFHGNTDHLHSNGPEYNDFARRPSPPGQGILPSPAQGMSLAMRRNPGSWDAYDPSHQVDRETKRSRRDGSMDGYPEGMDDRFDRSYGRGGPVGGRTSRSFPGSDYIWRGIIAKGGTPVCHARCIPIGNGIESELPEVINCSARTGLDMLAKHYAEAVGFDIVFFLPDSEDDFASYTEFLNYLGSKDRAGVAKFDDGTTLFLVPPSNFLTDVLKVSGPERLYGVVLKLPPPPPPAVAAPTYRQESLSLPSSYMDQPRASPANPNHALYGSGEERSSASGYNMSSNQMFTTPSSEPVGGQSVPKVGLTPELIATLTSLLPAAPQPATSESHQPSLDTSNVSSLQQQSVAPMQAWNQGYQPTANSFGHSYQQFGNQYDPQAQLPLPPPPTQNYPPMSNNASYSGGLPHGSMQYQEQPVSMPQQLPLPPRPLNNYPMFSGGSHLTAPQPVTQQYQPETAPINQNYGSDPSGMHGYAQFQNANNMAMTSTQPYMANNLAHPQNVMPPTADKGNVELPAQGQPFPVAGQGSAEGEEVDKNQRYQSTLQFAANILYQIQQQQQSNNPTGQGTGS